MANIAAAVRSISTIEGLGWRQEQQAAECLPSGIREFDSLLGGCPRGRITEILGKASSGRTSLLHRILAQAGANGEYCALMDGANSFDPESAAASGVALDRLVWVRCSGDASHAMKAADLLLHSGGLGVVALDLCDVAPQSLRRIPLSYWYRFQRVVEKGQCVLAVLSQEAQAKACATLLVDVQCVKVEFQGTHPVKLLQGTGFSISSRRPYQRFTSGTVYSHNFQSGFPPDA